MTSKVNFDPYGFANLWVTIPMRNKPDILKFIFKVDTGASCNTIDKNDLKSLGYDEDWIKSNQELVGNYKPLLASGKPMDGCYKIVLPEIRFGVYTGRNIRFITGLNNSFKLLLGTSTLRHFNWALDYENNCCEYRKNPNLSSVAFDSDEPCFYSIDDILIQ